MCWPCCWPCLVVDDPPRSLSPHSTATGEKSVPRPPVSRRRAIGEIAATKGFARQPVSRRPHAHTQAQRHTRRTAAHVTTTESSRTMSARLRPVISRAATVEKTVSRQATGRRRSSAATVRTTASHVVHRPDTADYDDDHYQSVSHSVSHGSSSVGHAPPVDLVPRQTVPVNFSDAPDAWLTPSMVGYFVPYYYYLSSLVHREIRLYLKLPPGAV